MTDCTNSKSSETNAIPVPVGSTESELISPTHRTLDDLEVHARGLVFQIDMLVQAIHRNLHHMSSLTLDCTKVFTSSVDLTCDTVDASIKSLYAVMAKCEELSKTMKKLSPMEKEIIAVKKTLDKFEEALRT